MDTKDKEIIEEPETTNGKGCLTYFIIAIIVIAGALILFS
jgi:hypothetical protein